MASIRADPFRWSIKLAKFKILLHQFERSAKIGNLAELSGKIQHTFEIASLTENNFYHSSAPRSLSQLSHLLHSSSLLSNGILSLSLSVSLSLSLCISLSLSLCISLSISLSLSL